MAEGAEADVVPVVADSVPLLLPLGGVEALPGPSAVELRPTKRQPQTWKTHYVCTGKTCGWSGSARTRHEERRPNCPFVPCPMRFRVGEPTAPLVKVYLAQCTEAQARLASLRHLGAGTRPHRSPPHPTPHARFPCAEGARATSR